MPRKQLGFFFLRGERPIRRYERVLGSHQLLFESLARGGKLLALERQLVAFRADSGQFGVGSVCRVFPAFLLPMQVRDLRILLRQGGAVGPANAAVLPGDPFPNE